MDGVRRDHEVIKLSLFIELIKDSSAFGVKTRKPAYVMIPRVPDYPDYLAYPFHFSPRSKLSQIPDSHRHLLTTLSS